MAFAPGLILYLALSRRAAGLAGRVLNRRLAAGKEHATRIGERRGEPGRPRPEGRLIWFHAASVGEVLSILELIRRLAGDDPDLNFLITSGTVTSAQAVASRLPDRSVHQFIPLDVVPFVRRFLDHWRPDLAVWTESELRPALIVETHARGVPMVLVNARLSDRSYRRWWLMPWTASALLNRFAVIHAQDGVTSYNMRRLGLNPDRIEVTGTLKEGSSALPFDEPERADLAQAIGRRGTWLAASTHAGEEELAADAHREILRRAPRMLMILVPRHPERGRDIADILRLAGWRVALRSADEPLQPDTEIYVADTLGEMGLWYRIAPISLVCGSLVPVGGHNPFEPAALGSAILHGPHVANFRDIYERLAAADAAMLVRKPDEITAAVTALLAPDRVAAMAHAAWEVCSSGARVTDRALEMLQNQLDEAG